MYKRQLKDYRSRYGVVFQSNHIFALNITENVLMDNFKISKDVYKRQYYINLVEFLKSMLGLISFSTVILLLNPIVILILLVTYLIDGVVSIKIQQWEIGVKEERAVVNRRLGYVLDDISNSLMAKDIKIYKMVNWINENTSKYINESKELEKKVQRKYTYCLLYTS